MRVALFFNHALPFTTGHYVRSSLEKVCQVDAYLPAQAKDKTGKDYDFYLCIDDASHHLNLRHLTPTAFWVMDTHMTYKADFIMARHFDYVFASQKDGAVRFRHDGIVNAVWLPFGCDPEIHGKCGDKKIYDVAFVGSDGWGLRRRLLEQLRKRFTRSYIGRAPHTELGKIYCQAKIVFNCSIFNDLNMRVFEALCSGSCLVTNSDASGLTDLFIAGKHLLTYSSEDEAISVIEHYLANDAEREEIAQAGRAEALRKHTYFHRVRTIMETVLSENDHRPGRPDNSWFAQCRDAFYLKTLEQVYKVDYHIRKWFA
jgi:hypothetical protein